jgi:hypothetical protein
MMHPICVIFRISFIPTMKFPRAFTTIKRTLVVALCAAWAIGAMATTVVPPTFDQLVNESDYIIRAVVKSVTSEYRTNTSGKTIITKVALDVREVVAGTPPPEVVLEILGGKIGDEQLVLAGAPQFKVGDEDILFVKGNGRTVVPLMAMMHGRYPILHEAVSGRRYMARDNKVPLGEIEFFILWLCAWRCVFGDAVPKVMISLPTTVASM